MATRTNTAMRSNKQLLDEVFETLIILHITKTESYNCFIIHFKCRKPLTKFNKTSAEAFTPPAEKKIGTKWALCTTAQAGNIKKWLFKNIIIHCSCFMPCDWSIACTR